MKKKMIIAMVMLMAAFLVACSKSAKDYSDEGMEYYENGDYVRAVQYLEKAVAKDKADKDIKINYGMTLIQNNRLDEAINVFTECINEKSDEDSKIRNKKSYRGLGIAYLQQKNYAKSIEAFEKALSINIQKKWNTDIKYYEANAQKLVGNVDRAVELYSDIIEENPKSALAYCARGNIYRDKEQFADALADYNNALLYCEGNFEIYIGLAACYLDSGHDDEAKEALFLASLLENKTNEDKFYLAVVHYYQGLFDSAKSEMEYALANGFTDANFYLAEICFSKGEYEKALEYFDEYSKSNVVESPTVCNDYAVCYMYVEDYDKAYEWLEKGLEFPNSGVVRELKRNVVACLEGKGEYSKAAKELKEYLAEYPDDEGAKKDYEFLSTRAPMDVVANTSDNVANKDDNEALEAEGTDDTTENTTENTTESTDGQIN